MTADLADRLLELPGLSPERRAALDADGRIVAELWADLPAAERVRLTRLYDQIEAAS